jgi:hypothetical protein
VPDLCVEVLLDSDRSEDIERRIAAYLEGGAREVIAVGSQGQVDYFGESGRRKASIFDVAISLDPMYFEDRVAADAVIDSRR